MPLGEEQTTGTAGGYDWNRRLSLTPSLLLSKPDPLALGSGFVLSLVGVEILTDCTKTASISSKSGLLCNFSGHFAFQGMEG